MNGVRELYRVEQLPVFQNQTFVSQTAAQHCPKGDVILVYDSGTGLVFNSAFDPSVMVYDETYQNEQALSPAFQKHLHEVAGLVTRNLGSGEFAEIGCGKGFFLEYMKSLGFRIKGFDPAYEGSNPDVRKEYVTANMQLQADGIILRHVLEHVKDPFGLLDQVRQANRGRGRIYIEVPCFDWICARGAWFDVFYEHVNYFRLSDFNRFFGVIHAAGHLFGGQYLYVVAELESLRRPVAGDDSRIPDVSLLQSGCERMARAVSRAGDPHGRRRAIWGGSSKGVVFAVMMQRAGIDIEFAIDINPVKQGRYLPGSGMRIHSPDEAMPKLDESTDVLVMNGNYLDEIRAMSRGRFNCLAVDRLGQ